MTFLQKYDPKGNFIRKYIPALRHFPKEYIFEPWKADIKTQSKARCIIGVDYPSRVVTEKEIREIFETAKELLRKNHNVDLDLEVQTFEHRSGEPTKPAKSEGNFTLKDKVTKPENKKFRVQVRESTRIGTQRSGMEESQELESQERVVFRQTMEEHKIDPMEPKADPREKVIPLQSLSKEKKPKEDSKHMPEHLVEKRVAGKKELLKHSEFEIIHYQHEGRKPQMAWHKIDDRDGKITFIDRCNGLEKQRILSRNQRMMRSKMFSFKEGDTKSQMDRLMQLNEKLIEMAQSQGVPLDAKASLDSGAKPRKEGVKNGCTNLSSGASGTREALRDSKTSVYLKQSAGPKLNVVSKTLESAKHEAERRKLNPLEISTVKMRENGKNTVVCHVKVSRDDTNKSVDIDILNEENNKKIMVISRKSLSRERVGGKRRARGRNGAKLLSQENPNKGQGDYNFKMNFFMKNNKRIDTDEFFKDIMKKNDLVVQENNLREREWRQNLVCLKKRSSSGLRQSKN